MVSAQPSRFIAEMGLDKTTAREDPREKLKALRAEFAAKKALADSTRRAERRSPPRHTPLWHASRTHLPALPQPCCPLCF